MLKKYYMDKEGSIVLVSRNPECAPINANEKFRIIGKVIRGSWTEKSENLRQKEPGPA
jgi:SOS-response transcriptional repressor LexA